MNIKRKLTSLTAAVALAATTLVPIATSANAEPWNGGHRYGGYAHNDRGDYGRGGDYGHGGDYGRGRDGGRHDFYAYPPAQASRHRQVHRARRRRPDARHHSLGGRPLLTQRV